MHQTDSKLVKSRCVSPRKDRSTPRDVESSREDATQQSQLRTANTPHFSPHKYSKTLQNEGSSETGTPSQLDYQKRKKQSPCKESPEKVSQRYNSGNFADSMIRLWGNHVGMQSPLPQAEQQEYELVEEMKQMSALKDLKIQKLMKKLENAEEAISLLNIRLQAEQEASMEILKELNTDGELISNYCRELAAGLKGLQEHKDILTEMYNDIKFNQTNFIVKLRSELNTTKLNAEEYEKTVSTIRNQIMQKNRRIQELEIAETKLKEQLQDMEKSMLERNQLFKIHADEKTELTKKWENLMSTNQELQIQLQRIAEEKQELANVLIEKDVEIMNLKKEIDANRNMIASLLCQNSELSKEYEELIKMKERLMAELKSKEEETEELIKNINTREEIESKLGEELKLNQDEYNHLHSKYANLKNELKAAQADNLNLERSLQDVKLNDEKKIFELNRKIRFLEMEKDRMNSEKSSNAKEIENDYKSREEKYKAEIEKLKADYDDKLTEIKKIEAHNSVLIKSREEHRAEIEKLKKDYDVKLTEMNEKNKIVQEKESFEKLQKYLKEKEEKQKLIKQTVRDTEDFEKYLKEHDGTLLKKEEEVFEKQLKDMKEVTYGHKHGDGQKDEPFKSVEKCPKENKSYRSRQKNEALYEQLKYVKEKEENENELTKDSPIKAKTAVREKAKSVTESVEQEYSENQREAETSKGTTLSQFNERIEKRKGTNEDKNGPSPKKIFTTGVRTYSRSKSQTRKGGKF